MAFTKVEKGHKGNILNRNEIRMGSRLAYGRGTSRAIYFSISGTVVESIGWELHDADADRVVRSTNKETTDRVYTKVALLEGSGEDAGFIVLQEDFSRGSYTAGADRATTGPTSIYMTVTIHNLKHYVLNDVEKEIEPQSVEFSVNEKEKSILIQAPDWLRYNPQSLPEPEPIKEVQPTVIDMHHKGRRRQMR